MCIVSGAVERISGTKILIARREQNLQLTVYANAVVLKAEHGAMILPVPQGDITFLDLSGYPNLFKDLHAAVHGHSLSRSVAKSLKVVDVGSYRASVVPSIRDLEHLSQEFRLDPRAVQFVREHYAEGFGFVVCQLASNKTYHPFGYIHHITSPRLFVPTMHLHDHGQGSIVRPDWDHDIYVADGVMDHPATLEFGHGNQMAFTKGVSTVGWLELGMRMIPQSIAHYRIGHYQGNHDLWVQPCEVAPPVRCTPQSPDAVLPDYVVKNQASCDLCQKVSLRFGAHTEPNVDLCMDCFHRFQHERNTVDIMRLMHKIPTGEWDQWVKFAPE